MIKKKKKNLKPQHSQIFIPQVYGNLANQIWLIIN